MTAYHRFNSSAGLDIDALRDVANAVNGLKTDKTATLMVTHYKRLLNYIQPEHVHVMEVLLVISPCLCCRFLCIRYPSMSPKCWNM